MYWILVLVTFFNIIGGSFVTYEKEFLQFVKDYKREYTQQEYQIRFEIFKQNLQFIENHNLNASHTFKLKMNQFGDLTNSEYKIKYTSLLKQSKEPHYSNFNKISLPTSWDWRAKGAVTPIKSQGQCGSCWAFSVTGAVEGCHFINTGKLVSVSEQNLVDCDTTDDGCNGGLMDNGYQYIINNHGIDSESCYPYTSEDGTCHYSASCCASTVTNYTDVAVGNENALQIATYYTTVAVGVDASLSSFQFYTSGVYYDPDCSSTNLDHSMLVVGWGVETGSDYWIVKNSWAKDWGMQGYILMSRNKGNNCGIASMASYVTGCFDCK